MRSNPPQWDPIFEDANRFSDGKRAASNLICIPANPVDPADRKVKTCTERTSTAEECTDEYGNLKINILIFLKNVVNVLLLYLCLLFFLSGYFYPGRDLQWNSKRKH